MDCQWCGCQQGRLVLSYVQGVLGNWLQQQAQLRPRVKTTVQLQQRIWFNNPNCAAVIIWCQADCRDYDPDRRLVNCSHGQSGSEAQWRPLIVTPVAMWEVLLGKLIPYYLLGMGEHAVIGNNGFMVV